MKTGARIALAAITLIAGLTVYVLWGSGIFLTIPHQFSGQCRAVHGIKAAEDVVVQRDWHMAYLSSFDENTAGIFAYDLAASDPQPVNILPAGFGAMRSLGMSIWHDPEGGADRLFVVNRAGEPRIEIFEFETPLSLRFVERVTASAIRYPNDVAATGPSQFYVSETHEGAPGSFYRLLETYLRLPTGKVLFFDGRRARVVVNGIGYPNGVAVGPGGREVYVASTATSEVFRLARQPNDDLRLIQRIKVPGRADNIDVGPDGTVTVALHPKALDAARHLVDASVIAPTRIVEIAMGDEPVVRTVYEDPGTEISAGATGVMVGTRLLIGPVHDDHFLDCRMNGS